MITITDLTKSYGDQRVLEGLSLAARPGEIHGIIGANGAGKTTFFRCVTGLEPHGGSVAWTGGRIKDRCGYLPTEPYFFPRITGREYLRLVCIARGEQHTDHDARNLFDLPLDKLVDQYSTGMKKKLALLALLLVPNDLFILDEPFNGVDIQSNAMIHDILLQLRDRGAIVLLSSHIFATLSDTCDALHLLQDGHFAQHATRGDFHRIEQAMRGSGDDRVRRFFGS